MHVKCVADILFVQRKDTSIISEKETSLYIMVNLIKRSRIEFGVLAVRSHNIETF